jgi:hypothetical protein
MGLGVLLVPFGVPRADLFAECGLCRDTTPKALTTQMAEFNLRHVEPTAVFGSIMDLSFIRDPFRLRWIKSFIKRRLGMGIEIVHHQTNFFHMRLMLINKFSDKIRPIHLCPLCCDLSISLTYSWCKSHKNVCGSISLILCIIPQWLARESGERSTNFPKQLGRHFIHTYVRILRIIRFFLDISDCFHVTDKGGIVLWRHTPFFLLPRCTFVFFHVRRTVSWDTAAIISSSTIFSASMRKVHRSCPSGAGRQ